MKKTTKVWLITAAALVLAGGILYAGAMAALGWDFSKLSTVRYEMNTYEISEPFRDISVTAGTADIELVPTEYGVCRVVCYEEESAKHTVAVEDGTLVIRVREEPSWQGYIGLSFGSPRITLYLPEAEYRTLSVHGSVGAVEIPADFAFESAEITLSTGNAAFYASAAGTVSIRTDTGNIRAEHLSAGALDLAVTTGAVTAADLRCAGELGVKVTTGKAKLSDAVCGSLSSDGSTGSLTMTNVVAEGKISVERSTGDVRLEGCDAAELFIRTGTGDVSGSLLSEKVFLTDTGTGRVEVPKSVSGGRCEITTGTGDIQITIEN